MAQVRSVLLLLLVVACSSAHSADLYEVTVGSTRDAKLVSSIELTPLCRTADGYLVLAEAAAAGELARSGLAIRHLASGVTQDELAIDMSEDDSNAEKYPVVFQEGDLRLLRVDYRELTRTAGFLDLAPLRATNVTIDFREPEVFHWRALGAGIGLDSLIDLVQRDSLISYTERMQAFYRRVAGTDSNAACADWLIDKLQEFGYDSVVSDTFTDDYGGEPMLFENVIAYRIGSMYPNRYIVIGGHRDAAQGSPGADDDASGTASTMEMARVLAQIETKVTFVFIAFDGEEVGLYGSYQYANAAAARGDTILFMLNSDMIGHYENSDTAWALYCVDSAYAVLWRDLADSLLGMVGITGLSLSGSDHVPFLTHGYPIVFPDEWIFSTVYHSPHDSTVYLSYDYMTKMTKASLATAYAAMLNATVPALEFGYPSGVPRFVTPGDAVIRGISISGINGGEIVPGSATMHFSLNGAPYQTTQMAPIAEDIFEGVIRNVACGDTVKCYFSAEEAITGSSFDSDSLRPLRLDVATSYAIIFDENFETDNGWLVWGDAADGHWERAIPTKVAPPGAPAEDFDGSGYCYLTNNEYINSDVDNGSTMLASPQFDLSGGDARISYARWYDTYNYGQPDQDSLVVQISSDAGMNWTLVEIVGPEEQASGGWYTHDFWASELVSPTNLMKLRFIASDIGNENRVEAAIDAILVASFECGYEPPFCGDADASGIVDVDDAVFLVNFIFLAGPAPNPYQVGDADCSGDVNISDVVYLVAYIFAGDDAPCDTNGDGVPDC